MARDEHGWIETVSGRQFWPLDPRPEDVALEDIAHALSMKCRFTGHCRLFYSVAQHSVLVSRVVPVQDAQWALMHDASEAYLPDVARPLKAGLIGFREHEARVMRAIATRFCLQWPIPDSVHRADTQLLVTERRVLMPRTDRPWFHANGVEPLHVDIEPWTPDRASFEFVHRFCEVFD